ncbi:MAG TPA: sugar phosphate isomerase/epimerase family protein [Methylomirabilota bacterium]|nr:sugar phosphate isomerase/epimerase family protein [Methylomirabilota bacterium]
MPAPAFSKLKSAITISLVPQARGGPFVFWDDLREGCATAAKLGFDAVEIFAPSAETLRAANLKRLLQEHNLKLAALGTGGGWVLHKLHLTQSDPAARKQARAFILSILEVAAEHGAQAIIGSMHGRVEPGSTRAETINLLTEALAELDVAAGRLGAGLLLEPVNRYETNFLTSVVDTAQIIREAGTKQIRVLADLFHMNIEETSITGALEQLGPLLGHVHLADSNRRAAGAGHLDYAPIMHSLRKINYTGYLSGEVLPLPDSESAARQQVETFRKLVV